VEFDEGDPAPNEEEDDEEGVLAGDRINERENMWRKNLAQKLFCLFGERLCTERNFTE